MGKSSEMLCELSKFDANVLVLNALKGTGFDHIYHLAKILGRNAHDNQMLSALKKYYDIQDRVFKINNKTLFFGLEDALLITGLPIEGKPVIKSNSDSDFLTLLGEVPSSEIRPNSNSVSLKWLKERFEVVPAEVIAKGTDSEQFARYVRGFVLYILGTVIFCTKQVKHISMSLLEFLRNIREIKDYAWGVAMLSHLHLSLEKDKDKDQTNGHTFFIMVSLLSFSFGFISCCFGFVFTLVLYLYCRFGHWSTFHHLQWFFLGRSLKRMRNQVSSLYLRTGEQKCEG